MNPDQRLWQAGERWDERLARAAAGAAHGRTTVPDQRLLDGWRRAVDGNDGSLFARRLAWAGLDERAAISALTDNVAITIAPAWWPAYVRLRDAARAAAAGPQDDAAWLAAVTTSCGEADITVPFIHLWLPAVQRTWADSHARRTDCGGAAAVDAAAARDAQLWLAGRLAYLAVRSLMALFTATRPAAESFACALGGDLPQADRARYAAFTRAMAADGLNALAEKCPVLPRLLAVAVQHGEEMLGELLARLQADADAVADVFGAARPLRVLRLMPGAGDAHRGGRTVTIITLAGAAAPVRVVYKPKDMRLEHAYHALAAEYVGMPAGASAVRVLAVGDTHGYVTFIAHRPAGSTAERAVFYRNAGRLLALLHLLGATDCHYGNIIACGDMPVLIDPETLFDSRVGSGERTEETAGLPGDFGTSVLRVGMLPSWQYSAARKRATDISALGADPEDAAAMTVGWRQVNTDAIAFGPHESPRPEYHSLPVGSGEANPLPQYVDELADGFAGGYRALLAPGQREKLAKQLAGLTGMRRRSVLRATRIYAVMEQRLCSPPCLRSAAARGLELERLARGCLAGAQPHPYRELFTAELHDMEMLDIPYFDHALGSRDLCGGGRVICGALAEDGLNAAIERVRRAAPADIDWQVQLIRAAAGARSYRMGGTATAAAISGAADSGAWRDGEQAALFAGLLDQLERSAVRDAGGRRTWLSFGLLGDGMQAGLSIMDDGLYSGRAGLVAFLATLAAADVSRAVTSRAAALAEETWHPLGERLMDAQSPAVSRILRDGGLGLAGAGGILQLLALPGIPVPAAARESMCMRLIAAIDAGVVAQDMRLDIIGGAAGAIGPVAALGGTVDEQQLHAVLRRLAAHLLARQDARTGGWLTPVAPRALTGYAHGAAGIGLALLRAGTVLGDERCLAAGARAFAHERAMFDARRGNWPDLRGAAPGYMHAWCHGAAGIGLARWRALQLLPSHPEAAYWREELRLAGTAIAAVTLPADHLCCGNAGRAVTLQALGNWTGDRSLTGAGNTATEMIRAHWRATGAFRGNDLGTGTTVGIAGFMTGLPGIGMHLLGEQAKTALLALLA
ncbi:MAG TPA: type 2 lanthipeptide synthetase LanM [bacterium]|nr:type 2 lanthipeptide synthetase LanM [bacterium]